MTDSGDADLERKDVIRRHPHICPACLDYHSPDTMLHNEPGSQRGAPSFGTTKSDARGGGDGHSSL